MEPEVQTPPSTELLSSGKRGDRTATLRGVPTPDEKPVLTVEEAGALLDLGRSAAYDAARRGDIPTIAIGRRLLVPTAAIRRMLHLDEAA